VATGPQVKGVAFRGILSASERVFGAQTVGRALELVPPDLANAIRNKTLIVGGWYPLASYRALIGAIDQLHPGRLPEASRDATLDDFRYGIYKVLTFVLSPQFVIKRSPGLFNRYYDTGKLEVPTAREGTATARFTGCTGFDALLWRDVLGGCIGVLEACGGKGVQMHIDEGGGNADHCTATATWS
jgi:hypothetical protein